MIHRIASFFIVSCLVLSLHSAHASELTQTQSTGYTTDSNVMTFAFSAVSSGRVDIDVSIFGRFSSSNAFANVYADTGNQNFLGTIGGSGTACQASGWNQQWSLLSFSGGSLSILLSWNSLPSANCALNLVQVSVTYSSASPNFYDQSLSRSFSSTSSSGLFTFTGVPIGTYNLIVLQRGDFASPSKTSSWSIRSSALGTVPLSGGVSCNPNGYSRTFSFSNAAQAANIPVSVVNSASVNPTSCGLNSWTARLLQTNSFPTSAGIVGYFQSKSVFFFSTFATESVEFTNVPNGRLTFRVRMTGNLDSTSRFLTIRSDGSILGRITGSSSFVMCPTLTFESSITSSRGSLTFILTTSSVMPSRCPSTAATVSLFDSTASVEVVSSPTPESPSLAAQYAGIIVGSIVGVVVCYLIYRYCTRLCRRWKLEREEELARKIEARDREMEIREAMRDSEMRKIEHFIVDSSHVQENGRRGVPSFILRGSDNEDASNIDNLGDRVPNASSFRLVAPSLSMAERARRLAQGDSAQLNDVPPPTPYHLMNHSRSPSSLSNGQPVVSGGFDPYLAFPSSPSSSSAYASPGPSMNPPPYQS